MKSESSTINRKSAGHVNAPISWHPDWAKFSAVCAIQSVDQAMGLYYKADRLNRPGGTRGRLVADRQSDLGVRGWTLLASHHDSAIGVEVYARQVGEDVVVLVPTTHAPGAAEASAAKRTSTGPLVTTGVVPGGVNVTIKEPDRDMTVLTPTGSRAEMLAIAEEMERDASKRLRRAAQIRRGAQEIPLPD